MKAAAIILLALGLLAISAGLVSCHRYYSVPRAPAPYGDADGDTRPYLAFQGFFLITAAGVVALSIGAYLYGQGRQKKVANG
jgi:hypothetical protein